MDKKPEGLKLNIDLPGNMEAIDVAHEVVLYCSTCAMAIARFYNTNEKEIKKAAREHAGGTNLINKLWTEEDELNYQLGDYSHE